MSEANENGSAEAESDLEQAMQEAVQAVEKRERSNSDEDADKQGIEILGGDDPENPAEEKESKKIDASSAVTEALIAAKKELEEALEQTRSQYTQLRGKWMRAAADLDNYKKRSKREREEAVKFGNERLIRDILPVFDDLDRTLEVVDAESTETNLNDVIDGIKMVQKKFLSQLEKHDVISFESKGTAFDPAQHEAVHQTHSEEISAGGVVTEMRRGFFLSGRLLRPSLVTVSLGSETPVAEETKTSDTSVDKSDTEPVENQDDTSEDQELGE